LPAGQGEETCPARLGRGNMPSGIDQKKTGMINNNGSLFLKDFFANVMRIEL